MTSTAIIFIFDSGYVRSTNTKQQTKDQNAKTEKLSTFEVPSQMLVNVKNSLPEPQKQNN